MLESIEAIFKKNINLIDKADKSIYYFRSQKYEEGLLHIAETVEGICGLVEEIIKHKDYFKGVDFESMLEMLEGITRAKKREDYVLLADLYEMQVIDFACKVQELIINKESYPYDSRLNEENISRIREFDEELYHILEEPVEAEDLLKNGYFVEYASCGLMTLAAKEQDSKYYLHSNTRIGMEAFLFAKSLYRAGVNFYNIYGLGMGYHIKELAELDKNAVIRVFEGDLNIIRLACAFSDLKKFLEAGRVILIYDPNCEKLKEALEEKAEDCRFCVHYPSYRRVDSEAVRKLLKEYISGAEFLEDVSLEKEGESRKEQVVI